MMTGYALDGPINAAVAAALQRHYWQNIVPVAGGPFTFDRQLHRNALLNLADGLGEVIIIVPSTVEVGDAFAVTGGPGSWPRIVFSNAGQIRHWAGHAAGIDEGCISLVVLTNPDGINPTMLLTGMTQP